MVCHRLQFSLLLFLLSLQLEPESSVGFHITLPHLFQFHRHTPPTTIKLPNDSPQLPISSTFQLPSPLLNSWPAKQGAGGGGFATGVIDLGALNVTQLTTLKKIWASYEGGPDNLGATVFEPSEIPKGYVFLGSYAQPNNKPLSGWLLVAKEDEEDDDDDNDDDNNNKTLGLATPVDYTLIWSSQSLDIKQDGPAYIWTPIPPAGYKAVGHIVTVTPDKPPLDYVRCVRADLTHQCQPNRLIWESNGLTLFSSKPLNVSVGDTAVDHGGFIAQSSSPTTTAAAADNSIVVACLRNSNHNNSSITWAAMPSMHQLEALIQTYSPIIYLHPDEEYHPSSVNWYFANGAMLYTRDSPSSNPVKIQPNGTNLPQDGTNDGAYWIDLPPAADAVKRGHLNTSICYLHVKPMAGGTVTDIAVWVFYPFNGPARVKLELVTSLSLGKVGQHVGDWEHVTLRVGNFLGELRGVYFSQHNRGEWVDATDLQFENGTSSRVVAYASLHGHAMYPRPGTVVHGGKGVGVRDDTAKGGPVLDVLRNGWEVIAADYEGLAVAELPWVRYMREWGPRVRYDVGEEIGKASGFLPALVKKEVQKAVHSLPPEMLGQEGPTGPKAKGNWFADESS